MKALILLANGFEDTEALSTRDVLTRAGLEVTTASITDSKIVRSSFGVVVGADAMLNDLDYRLFDALILPGGGKGTSNLSNSTEVLNTIKYFADNKKLVAAICAAPGIVGRLGYYRGKRYTCFAGCNGGVEGEFTGNEVEIDGEFITARSMRYSIPFALAIIEKMLGRYVADQVVIGLEGKMAK